MNIKQRDKKIRQICQMVLDLNKEGERLLLSLSHLMFYVNDTRNDYDFVGPSIVLEMESCIEGLDRIIDLLKQRM